MDDHLACYGCGLIFDSGEATWDMSGDDFGAVCPDCGSSDTVTYETYLEDMH